MISLITIVVVLILVIQVVLYMLSVNSKMRLFALYVPEATVMMAVGVGGTLFVLMPRPVCHCPCACCEVGAFFYATPFFGDVVHDFEFDKVLQTPRCSVTVLHSHSPYYAAVCRIFSSTFCCLPSSFSLVIFAIVECACLTHRFIGAVVWCGVVLLCSRF